jgi:hypothetical protein
MSKKKTTAAPETETTTTEEVPTVSPQNPLETQDIRFQPDAEEWLANNQRVDAPGSEVTAADFDTPDFDTEEDSDES